MLAACCLGTAAQENIGGPGARRIIVSPVHPQDSRGETVYALQDKDHLDIPLVSGAFTPMKPLRTVPPEFTDKMRRERAGGRVLLQAVATPAGDVIDVEILKAPSEDAGRAAADAVRHYTVQAPTLDGTQVAMLFKMVVNFSIHRGA